MISLLIIWCVFGIASMFTCCIVELKPTRNDIYYIPITGLIYIVAFFSGPLMSILITIYVITEYDSRKSFYGFWIYQLKKIYFKTCRRKILPLYVNKKWETQELEDIFKRRLYGTKRG